MLPLVSKLIRTWNITSGVSTRVRKWKMLSYGIKLIWNREYAYMWDHNEMDEKQRNKSQIILKRIRIREL